MAITNYAELSSAIQDWTDDTNTSGRVPDFIQTFESQMNRRVRARQMETSITTSSLTAAADEDLPAGYLEMRSIVVSNDKALAYRTPQFIKNNSDAVGTAPRYYSILGTKAIFAPAITGTVEFDYYQRIPDLTTSNTSNWLLDDHPDLYLYGSLLHAVQFLKVQESTIAMWKQIVEQGIEELNASSQGSIRGTDGLAR